MKSILKKTQRKDRRIAINGSCFVVPQNSNRRIPVEVLDLSLSGMGFYCAEMAYARDSFVEIFIPGQRKQHLILKGKIIISPDPEEKKSQVYYRYSVRFENKLTNAQINTLLSCLDFKAPELRSA